MLELTYTLNQLPEVARELLPSLQGRGVVAFYGAMGVGKTTLIKAICEALGVEDSIDSPTFALVNEYHAANGEEIYHFDFYRINSVEEVFDFGYEEYFYSGKLCLLEWPEKIEDLLPEDTLQIHIAEDANGQRRMTFNG